jgi:hypothetical protein
MLSLIMNGYSNDRKKSKEFVNESEEFFLNGGEEHIHSTEVQFYLL